MSILSKEYDFTAFFCSDDSIATCVMQAIYDAGCSIPDDISIIGCDDHSFAQFSHPSICTFKMNEEPHGKQLIPEIQLLINGVTGTTTISNKAYFIKRQSLKVLH